MICAFVLARMVCSSELPLAAEEFSADEKEEELWG
jgi:hypothetical protein